jgi:hypothetical protein
LTLLFPGARYEVTLFIASETEKSLKANTNKHIALISVHSYLPHFSTPMPASTPMSADSCVAVIIAMAAFVKILLASISELLKSKK